MVQGKVNTANEHNVCGKETAEKCYTVQHLTTTWKDGIRKSVKSGHIYNSLPQYEKKSEIRMTASILKQDPKTSKVQKNAIYYDRTQIKKIHGRTRF